MAGLTLAMSALGQEATLRPVGGMSALHLGADLPPPPAYVGLVPKADASVFDQPMQAGLVSRAMNTQCLTAASPADSAKTTVWKR